LKVILEFDDLHHNPDVDCLPVAEELIKTFPNLIINFFVPPCYNNVPLYANKTWCDKLRSLISAGNVCLGVHGTYHSSEEYKYYNYTQSVDKIKLSENIFRAAKLPFVRVFRAPQWTINQHNMDALCDLGYTHIYSHTNFKKLNEVYKDKITVVYYNWNLKDTYGVLENPLQSDTLVSHGHTSQIPSLSCGNSIYDQFDKICNFVEGNTLTFLRIDEYA